MVEASGWDILFTDEGYTRLDPNSSIDFQIPMMWRPDLSFVYLQPPEVSSIVNEDFRKITHRQRTHLIVYWRSGVEKNLNFFKESGMFSPFGHELFLVPDLKAYEIRKPIVTCEGNTSDTTYHYFESL